jgi:hypothetical protein
MGPGHQNLTAIDGVDTAVLGHGALMRSALIAANINPETGLATDYLNHFNEVVMLMEMLPAMPDCAEDVLDWEPLDYCGHFEKSGLKDVDVILNAYQAVPKAVKAHFETLIFQIDGEVVRAQHLLREAITPELAEQIAKMATEEIKPLIVAAGGAIHGEIESESEYVDEGAQADIDALFD